MNENQSSESLRRIVSRLLFWTVSGTVLGICMLPLYGLFTRYPLLNAFFKLCLLPAKAMVQVCDAGFVMIAVFMVAEWSVVGFLFGVGRTWYLRHKARQPAAITAVAPKRKSKRIVCAVLIFVVVVVGYCIYQEAAITKDRQFFLQQVEYKEFAEACLDIVVNPDKYQVTFERRDGNNPRLPEAIRKLKPAHVSYQGYSIRIDKAAYHQGLLFTHSLTNATEYNVVFQSNYKAPIHLYTLHSDQLPKIDWR